MIYKSFIALILLINLNNGLAFANSCQEHFELEVTLSVTNRLWVFVEELIQRQEIGLTSLERVLNAIDQKQTVNFFLNDEIQTNSSKLLYFETINQYLQSDELDLNILKKHIIEKITEIKQVGQERALVKTQTQLPVREIKFKSIGVPGRFMVGGGIYNTFSTKLTQAVALSDTHVTQHQWSKIMGKNPSHFCQGPSIWLVDGVLQQPNHPLENITWYAAVWFCNELSAKMNLPPTYNFKKFKIKPGTSANDGTLLPADTTSYVSLNASNIYKSKGIRLATSAELEWLQKAGGQSNKFCWGNDQNESQYYAWFNNTANNKTHEVASKQPINIRGEWFYDTQGNVYTWTNDKAKDVLYIHKVEPLNPQGYRSGTFRNARGGSYGDNVSYSGAHAFSRIIASKQLPYVGLRLALSCP